MSLLSNSEILSIGEYESHVAIKLFGSRFETEKETKGKYLATSPGGELYVRSKASKNNFCFLAQQIISNSAKHLISKTGFGSSHPQVKKSCWRRVQKRKSEKFHVVVSLVVQRKLLFTFSGQC